MSLERPSSIRRDRRLAVALLTAAVIAPALSAAEDADHWPRFRGPNGSGSSDLKGVPVTWTAEDYEWVVPLPGIGHSSPVVWDDALFLTTSTPDGARTLHRLNALTGQDVWTRTVHLGTHTLHQKNSYASGTPALDGERVYVLYADNQQHLVTAHTFAGEEVWTRDLGPFKSQHGCGTSPIVYKDLIVIANDQDGPGAVVAFNRRTGDEVWRMPRHSKVTSYATPFILDLAGRAPQLICINDALGVTGVDPETGRQLWASGTLPQRAVGSPVYGNGVVVATCGQGGKGVQLVAVDPSGEGDVSGSHVRYTRLNTNTKSIPYVPTPIVHGGHAYMLLDTASICCMEMATGAEVWIQRLEGNFSASPVLIDGRLYCVNEGGDIFVLDAAPEFRFHGVSPLGDGSHATPAVANGRVYFRGFGRLASLKARSGRTPAGGS